MQKLCFTQTHKFQTFAECYANLNGSTTNSSTLVHHRVFIFNFEFNIFLVKFSIIYVISNEIQAIKNHTKHCTTSFEHPSSISSTIFYFFIESILIPMQSRFFIFIYPWTCPWISREIPAHITVKRQPEIARIQTRIPTHPRLVNSRPTYTRERDLVFSDVNRFHWRHTSRSSCSWIFTSRLTPKYACLFIRQPDLHTTPMYREN